MKLPSQINLSEDGQQQQAGWGQGKSPSLLTILEAVIVQTSLYSTAHKGRLAVYLGTMTCLVGRLV